MIFDQGEWMRANDFPPNHSELNVVSTPTMRPWNGKRRVFSNFHSHNFQRGHGMTCKGSSLIFIMELH